MKLMAGPDFSAAREQSIPLRPKCPVADLKASLSGAEIKHTGHGMGVTLQVGELASQHQHPAAFGVDGMGGGEAPQGIHAGLTTRQFCSVLFGKSSWKDQAAGFVGDGFIGEGDSRAAGASPCAPAIRPFRDSGNGRRHRWRQPLGVAVLWIRGWPERIVGLPWCTQQGNQASSSEVLLCQRRPAVDAFLDAGQLMGWGQSEMAARQGHCVTARQAAQNRHSDASQHILQELLDAARC